MARRSMKWYKKLISYFLQLAMLNGYVLYSLEVKKMPFLNFVHDVSKTAVPEICHDCFFSDIRTTLTFSTTVCYDLALPQHHINLYYINFACNTFENSYSNIRVALTTLRNASLLAGVFEYALKPFSFC